ncbi:phosphoribosylamine--glycine ligase [Chlorogloea sp. CCALA 695]|uniref:phosphoribosylamine--glycine ligase n=1 Tax=Chlorogloea sp. CCALA 695 TaxID=2107693 RepID=UPI000D063C78|nr:phosphoribosylamine--glycine ligase [Chlorogloea sp. CCALA 695]PSB33350.1 phosphoribosylamine--glycine ligase [Chlorogloea sp. CCALA 695]
MKVLVVGNGGREHAIAFKLLQSSKVEQVFCAPGNGGTATLARCQNLALGVNDFTAIGQFAQDNNIDLIVIGPEIPLALGITDYLQNRGIKVFGPSRAGAQIEASKAWAKALMADGGIPTAKAAVFTDAAAARGYVEAGSVPIVIKADGLAAGKGVIVASTVEEAHRAINSIFQGQFGSAGKFVLVEECLIGQEVSVIALTDGISIRPLLPAQDHKRIGDGDTGDNTGGMGAYAPAPLITPELMAKIEVEVLQKAIATLRDRNIDYRGVLYAGLMVSPKGEFKVLEFNCRFGDPETQAILPLLETPLEDLLLACVEKRLGEMPAIAWKSGAACCVVASANGYPGEYSKGEAISGITSAEGLTDTYIFQAGTKQLEGQIVTDGGRVLGVTGIGSNFVQAIDCAYAAINCIHFQGMYYRRDIGYRVKK